MWDDFLNVLCSNSFLWNFFKKLLNQILSILWNILRNLEVSFLNQFKCFILILTFKWYLTNKELIDHNPKSPEITGKASLSKLKHFWRDVLLRANKLFILIIRTLSLERNSFIWDHCCTIVRRDPRQTTNVSISWDITYVKITSRSVRPWRHIDSLCSSKIG